MCHVNSQDSIHRLESLWDYMNRDRELENLGLSLMHMNEQSETRGTESRVAKFDSER